MHDNEHEQTNVWNNIFHDYIIYGKITKCKSFLND